MSSEKSKMHQQVEQDIIRLEGLGMTLCDEIPGDFKAAVLVCPPEKQGVTAMVHRQLGGIRNVIWQTVEVAQDCQNVVFMAKEGQDVSDAADNINQWINTISTLASQRDQIALLFE